MNEFLAGYAHPKWLYGRDPGIPNVASGIGLTNTSGNPGGPGFSVPRYSMNASLSFILFGTDNLYQLGDDSLFRLGSPPEDENRIWKKIFRCI